MANPAVWILIRGLIREQRHWGRFAEHLHTAYPGDRVLMLDIPGNGYLCRESSPLSILGMVESLRAQLANMNVEGPIRLVGLSMGGMIATCWLQTYPTEIERAVLINTSMRPFNRIDHRLRPQQYRHVVAALMAKPEQREAIIHDMTVNFHERRMQTLDRWHAWATESPVTPWNALCQLLAAARFKANPVPPDTVPILVLTSLGDRLVSWRCSKAIAERWKCPIFTHPNAGHDLPLDDPEWIITQVDQWLSPEAKPASISPIRANIVK